MFGFQNDAAIIIILWLIRNVIVNIGSCSLKLILCKIIIFIYDIIFIKRFFLLIIRNETNYIIAFTYLDQADKRTQIQIITALLNYIVPGASCYEKTNCDNSTKLINI